MPNQGVQVRSLVALQSRHVALCAYWTEYAVQVGLTTPAGIEALERASKDGQRAERLAVSSLDVAQRLAKSRPHNPQVLGRLIAEAAKERPQ